MEEEEEEEEENLVPREESPAAKRVREQLQVLGRVKFLAAQVQIVGTVFLGKAAFTIQILKAFLNFDEST